jgi:hypothetical protein
MEEASIPILLRIVYVQCETVLQVHNLYITEIDAASKKNKREAKQRVP